MTNNNLKELSVNELLEMQLQAQKENDKILHQRIFDELAKRQQRFLKRATELKQQRLISARLETYGNGIYMLICKFSGDEGVAVRFAAGDERGHIANRFHELVEALEGGFPPD